MVLLVGINFGAKALEQYAGIPSIPGILIKKQFVLSLNVVKMLNENFGSKTNIFNNV